MLIDWFTVIAQIVNFLILVWLLQRFLYRPILNAIDAREKHITTTVAEAEADKEEARKERDAFKSSNEEFSRQRASLLREAILEAKSEREKLFEAARNEAEVFRLRQQQAMVDDCNFLKEEILRRTREEVFAIAQKSLADLAGEDLEKRMVQTFLQRCRAMDETEKANLRSVLKSPSVPVCIRSAFPLEILQKQDIERTLAEIVDITGPFCFETSPELISGIAVSVDGYEVAWNINDYLQSLEKNIVELLLGQSSSDSSQQPAGTAGDTAETTGPQRIAEVGNNDW